MTAASDTHRAIDAVWRIESARIIAALARMVAGDRDVRQAVAEALGMAGGDARTADIGGRATTVEATEAILQALA